MKSKKKILPKLFVQPMKAEPAGQLPEGNEWIYEIKFDGYRALLIKDKGVTNVWSINGNSFNERFQMVWEHAQTVKADSFIIDGEVVALNENKLADFQTLQNLGGDKDTPLIFYAFDLLRFGKESLLDKPLHQRRKLLKAVIKKSKVGFSKTLVGSPQNLLEHVTKFGIEGLVAKRKNSVYLPGTRSQDWQKYKVINQQELVIGGFTKHDSDTFHNLLVGYFEKGKFKFAGKIYGGFTPKIRKELFPQLKKLITSKCPFSDLPEASAGRWGSGLTADKMKECTWLKPTLVCVAKFAEWTGNNHLRHGGFVALRDDKKAKQVGRH